MGILKIPWGILPISQPLTAEQKATRKINSRCGSRDKLPGRQSLLGKLLKQQSLFTAADENIRAVVARCPLGKFCLYESEAELKPFSLSLRSHQFHACVCRKRECLPHGIPSSNTNGNSPLKSHLHGHVTVKYFHIRALSVSCIHPSLIFVIFFTAISIAHVLLFSVNAMPQKPETYLECFCNNVPKYSLNAHDKRLWVNQLPCSQTSIYAFFLLHGCRA